MSRMMLLAGGNDRAGTMLSDDITAHAGVPDAGYLEPVVMERIVSNL
jgi:2-iminoacetate synthase ThiH